MFYKNLSVKFAGYVVGKIEFLVNIRVKMLQIEKLSFKGWYLRLFNFIETMAYWVNLFNAQQ